MGDSVLITIGDIELAALTLGGVLFLVAYSVLAQWWRTREGRFIFTAGLWLTVLFAYLYAARVGWLPPLDDSSARAFLRLIVLTPFAVGLVWISTLLLMAQIEQRRKRHESEEN